jgi:hypothetical protein
MLFSLMEPETKAKIFNTTILRGSKTEGMLDDNNNNLVKELYLLNSMR